MKAILQRVKTIAAVLSVALLSAGLIAGLNTLAPRSNALVMESHRMQGEFMVNAAHSDFALSLTPTAIAAPGPAGETVSFKPTQPYNPSTLEGTDDYHCFLLDPKLTQDRMVVGVNIQPQQGSIVHHVILFKITGDSVTDAINKNQESGGQGWTCFGGPNVGSSQSVAGSWLGAWVPGAGDGRLPEGIGSALPKGSLIVMQVHYNLLAGTKPDQSSAELTYAPAGTQLKAIQTELRVAPVEIPCPDGARSATCNRTNTLRENVKKFGQAGVQIPQGLLALCNKNLSDYQKPVGDAGAVVTSCERPIKQAGTLYSVAGHMHLLGRDIKLELNPGTPQAKLLLHIPRWDFHWQGNYWFKNPVEVKAGDTVRITCTYDNSAANQPVLAGSQTQPRYVAWGEGTADEMCLGVIGVVSKGN